MNEASTDGKPTLQCAEAVAAGEAPAEEGLASSFAKVSKLLVNMARTICTMQAHVFRAQAKDAARIWCPVVSGDRA